METAERYRVAGSAIGGVPDEVDDKKAQSECLYLLEHLRNSRCLDSDSRTATEQIHIQLEESSQVYYWSHYRSLNLISWFLGISDRYYDRSSKFF